MFKFKNTQSVKNKILLLILLTIICGCSKEYTYQYVYKVSYTSPKVNTIMTSFYTYNKFQNHHNSQWIQNDYASKNIDELVRWQFDSLWVDSLGLISM